MARPPEIPTLTVADGEVSSASENANRLGELPWRSPAGAVVLLTRLVELAEELERGGTGSAD